MASCSARVRSRSAWANPAAIECCSRAQRARLSSAARSWRAAVQHQIRVDDAERVAERLGVGAVRGDQGRADPPGRRARVEVPGLQGLVQRPCQRQQIAVSNSGRVSEVAVAGKIARLQMVANRRSLSSRPSGSTVEPVSCGGTITLCVPLRRSPRRRTDPLARRGTRAARAGGDTSPGSTISKPSKNRRDLVRVTA